MNELGHSGYYRVPLDKVAECEAEYEDRESDPNAAVQESIWRDAAVTEIDLNFLAQQNERLMTQAASLRDDMSVLTAIVLRLDGSMTALLQEIRETHKQIARMNDRILKLEA